MKQSKPTIRDIKSILNIKNIGGYNDKRRNGGRIKLIGTISHSNQQKLETELAIRYPDYQFACGNIISKPSWGSNFVATAIHFRLKKHK